MTEKYINSEIRKNTRICHITNTLLIVLMISLIVLGGFVMFSCSTTKLIPVETVKTDTIYKARKDSINFITRLNVKDSLKIKDSVVIHINDAGAIIGKDTWHWKEHSNITADSTFYYKTALDSVLKQQKIQLPKIVQVEKKLTTWERIKQNIGWCCFLILVALILYYIIKLGINKIKK